MSLELVDAHRDASKSDADAEAQEALKTALEKCKAAALRKGEQHLLPGRDACSKQLFNARIVLP